MPAAASQRLLPDSTNPPFEAPLSETPFLSPFNTPETTQLEHHNYDDFKKRPPTPLCTHTRTAARKLPRYRGPRRRTRNTHTIPAQHSESRPNPLTRLRHRPPLEDQPPGQRHCRRYQRRRGIDDAPLTVTTATRRQRTAPVHCPRACSRQRYRLVSAVPCVGLDRKRTTTRQTQPQHDAP